MINIVVRRKRSRMLMQAINTQGTVEMGNLKMVFFDGGLERDDWVKVYFRDSAKYFAAINVVGTFTVLPNPSHEHAATNATRYQIKQLKFAAQEIVAALVASFPKAVEA